MSLRRKINRILSVFLSFLLLLSPLLPETAFALQSDASIESSKKQDMTEEERERLYYEDLKQAQQESDVEFYSLISGLGFEPRGIEEKEPSKKIDEAIYEELETKDRVNVLIKMKDEMNFSTMYHQAKQIRNREDRIETVKAQLQNKADHSQKQILADLSSLVKQGKVDIKRSFWINNSILAEVDKETLEFLKTRDDVKEVVLDKVISLPEIMVEDAGPNLPAWGVEKINAPKVWGEYGIKGEGIVVGIMDTGVDWTHEALKDNYRGRDGNHQYSWADFTRHQYETPTDGHGHGTHVAGTAVGGGSGLPIGVAPGAEWIAAKIFDDNGAATTSGIHAAFEWFMAPGGDPSKAPHVVNNSWGNSNGYSTEFYEDVVAWISAGIFPLFAAGNDGPFTGTVGSPASFTNAFAVGATNQFNHVTDFSSRGPVYWPNEDGELEMVIKPDIMAPGYQIYSAYPESLGYGKYVRMNGTSMATPHVAGSIALLLSADPSLSIDEIKRLLVDTAMKESHMGQLPNNVYGNGVVDIYRAVTEAAFSGTFTGTVVNEDGNPVEATIYIDSEDITIETDKNGHFERKIREGSYQAKVSAFGYETFETKITITKGETTEVNLVLSASATFTLSGQVVGEDGPESYRYVRLKNTPFKAVYTDENGNFTFSNVPTGTYELQINGEGIKGKTVTVEIDSNQELTIEVEKATVTNSDWKTVNNNINRNAISPNVIAYDELEKDWEYKTDSKGSIVFSTPAATENRVVLVTERGWIVALDSESGEELWSIRLGDSNRSSPTIENGMVFVSGGNNQKVYALDLNNGQIRWEKNVGQFAIYESPIVNNGIVYVSSGLMPSSQSGNPKVYALDAETGNELWAYQLDGETYASMSLGDDYLYVGTYESRTMRALDPNSGEVIWAVQVEREGFSSRPVYHDGVLYAIANNFNNGSGTLYAFDGATGDILWSVNDIGSTEMSGPIVYENTVIVSSFAYPVLRAFNAMNGEELWRNEEVGPSYHNGSVAASGILFVAGIGGYFFAVDVYSGEILERVPIENTVTTGIPILPGKIFLPQTSGITSYIAPGTLEGSITDENGNGLEAQITVLETGKTAKTDATGKYVLPHTPGTFTIKVASYGYKQVETEVPFLSGYPMEKNFTLVPGEAGQFTLSVKDKRTKDTVSGAKITLLGTPLEGVTDENGFVQFAEVVEGTYTLSIETEGYATFEQSVTIRANENTEKTIELQPYDIAVLNDWNGEITKFLNNSGYFAVEKDWDVVDSIHKYKIIYLNGAYSSSGWKPDEETFLNLLEQAKAHDVSIIFADTWGGNYGSIHHLVDYLGDPKELSHEFSVGTIHMRVDREHPILKGYNAGDYLTLSTGSGDIAWFNGYSGIHLATVGSDRTSFKGTGVAYKGTTENSAHLLLSSHAATPWMSPSQGWSKDMAQILLNGIDYLFDAEFGAVDIQIVDQDNNPLTADVEIVNVNRYVGQSTYNLYLEPGDYTIIVRSPGYDSIELDVTVQYGETNELTVQLIYSEGSSLVGTVRDSLTENPVEDLHVTLLKDGESVAETTTSAAGYYELKDLEPGEYTVEFQKDGYISHRESVDIKSGANELSIFMTPAPKIAVYEDYFSGRNFVQVFNDIGVEVTQLSGTELLDRAHEFDVIFINEIPTSMRGEKIDELLKISDEANTSLIFGDNHYDAAAINQISLHRGDPEWRDKKNDNGQAAIYIVENEHPIFKNFKPGDEIDIRIPTRGRVAYFDGYSGYTLAKAGQKGSDPYGVGIAYKPRTKNSVELLMSGHGFDISYHYEHYTEEGKQLLIDAVIWAAYAQFPAIEGTVTDTEGNPLQAHIQVVGEAFEAVTNEENGQFSIAIEGGEYEIEVSSFGYKTIRIPVSAAMGAEPITIVMEEQDEATSITGKVENRNDGFAISDVSMEILGFPRKTTTDLQGNFTFEGILPGTYTIKLVKEGFAERFVTVAVEEGKTTEVMIELHPSPKVGILGDYNTTLNDYLEEKGYMPESFHFSELERVKDFDIIFANFDYVSDKNLLPKKADFEQLLKAIDEARIPVIWTGHVNDRGGIRFLNEFENNPSQIINGSSSSTTYYGMATEEHPITAGVQLGEPFPIKASFNYHYAFDGYDGFTIADVVNDQNERVGSMIAYKARTIDSVEILMANFTFSYYYNPGLKEFDEARERILSNAIHYALEYDEVLTGELHGKVVNHLGYNVQAQVTIVGTGKSITTDEAGQFFLGLQEGTYTLRIEAFGHETQEFSITIENGDVIEETFVLQAHDSGKIFGTVFDQNGNPIKDAPISVIGTEVTAKTDENGYFETILPVGTYHLEALVPGYHIQIRENIEVTSGGEVEVSFTLKEMEKIAVIASSNHTRITNFLNSVGYDADIHTNANLTPIIENIKDYSLIIYNDKMSATTEAQFKELIDTAAENGVSIIFSSQYGGGTIRELNRIYGDPESVSWSYKSNHINVKVLNDHPLFTGIDGEEFKLLQREDANASQQYAVYSGYSGTTIAQLTHDTDGVIGDGIGYTFTSGTSVHLLLSGMQIGSYSDPAENWTEEAKRLYLNAISWAIEASLGELNGKVTDHDGNPIAGALVTINGLNESTTTDQNGEFRLPLGTGVYEVTASAFGYYEQTKTVEIKEEGETVTLDFTLEKVPGKSISGTVSNANDESPIAGAEVTIVYLGDNLEVGRTNTDEYGRFTFNDLLSGDYLLTVEKDGYSLEEVTVTLGEESVELVILLKAIEIGVLGDYNGELTEFLNRNGHNAEPIDWSVLGSTDDYKLIIVNTNEGTKMQMLQLIYETDQKGISLLFLGTWGVKDGAIHLLENALGYPELDQHGYNEGAVTIHGIADHPLFKDLPESFTIHSEGSPYSTFKNYPGVAVGTLETGEGLKGTGIAYQYRSANSIHLLLSSFAVTNIVGPDHGWTEEGEKLFLNAIDFAMEVEQTEPMTPVWDNNLYQSDDGTVTLTGRGMAGDTIRIFAVQRLGVVELGTTIVQGDGTFSFEYEFEPGSHSLFASSENFIGKSDISRLIRVIVAGTGQE